MHPLALSTCWNSSRHKEGEPMLEEIRSLGFTHAEISHGLRYSKWPGILDAVDKGIIQVSSLHNFCPQPVEFLNSSPNYHQLGDESPSRRMSAVRHTIVTVENAAQVEAKAVVLHLGWAGPRHISRELDELFDKGRFLSRAYIQKKIEAVKYRDKVTAEVMKRVRDSLEKIIIVAQSLSIRLGFECRESFEEFPNEQEMCQLLEGFPSETVGYWHDFGHSARKHFLGWHTQEETLKRFGSRLVGCHVHDCLSPDQDHLALGKGELDFPSLLSHFPPAYLPVLELNPQIQPEEIIESKKIWDSYVSNSA